MYVYRLARETQSMTAPEERSSSAACGHGQPRYRRHPSSTDCQLYVACVTGPDGRYVTRHTFTGWLGFTISDGVIGSPTDNVF